MGNLDWMKQVEQLCNPSEKQNLTPLKDQVGNSRSDFDKKLKDVTSLIPGKWVNASKLEITLDSTLKWLMPQIREDAKNWCLAAKGAIKEATNSLSTQQSVDRYVLANKSKPSDGLFWWHATRQAQLDAQMQDAWLK